MPTILAWAGLSLEGSPASGTILRRGLSVLPRRGADTAAVEGHSFLRSYSFFNPQVGSIFSLTHPFEGCGNSSKDARDNAKERPAVEHFVVEATSARMSHALFEEPASASLLAAAATAADTRISQIGSLKSPAPVNGDSEKSDSHPRSCQAPSLRSAYARISAQASAERSSDLAAYRLSVKMHYDRLFTKKNTAGPLFGS